MQAQAQFNPYLDKKERKAKRLYQRMITGLQIASKQDQTMRFLTLTTSKNRVFDKNGNIRTPRKSFEILRKRIRRANIEKDGFSGFNFNKYYLLRTSEGNGVLHVIFWGGRYIPREWLVKNWLEIHGAYMVDIRFVHKMRHKISGLVGYLLDKYLLNQPIERMSYGWGWAWLGFCRSWEHVKYEYKSLRRGRGELAPLSGARKWEEGHSCRQAIPFWRGVLWNHPITSRQTKFFSPGRGFNRKYFNVSPCPPSL